MCAVKFQAISSFGGKFEITCFLGCFALICMGDFELSQLSCLDSSVDKSITPRTQWSWVQVPPEAAHFSLKNDCRGICVYYMYMYVAPSQLELSRSYMYDSVSILSLSEYQ